MGGHPVSRRLGLAVVVVLALVGLVVAAGAEAGGGARPGTVDRAFGRGGRAYSSLPPSLNFGTYTTVAEAPGGALVDILTSETALVPSEVAEAAIQRRLPDGSLDPSFGHEGSVTLPGIPAALAVDGSGGVLYAEGTVHRLDPDGSPDAGFDPPAEIHDGFEARQIVVAPDGDIVLAGTYSIGGAKDPRQEDGIVVARLHPDGRLDQGFAEGGVLTIRGLPVSPYYEFHEVAALADGSLLVLANGAVFRFGSDGAADKSFGKEGILALPDRFTGATLLGDAEGGFTVAGEALVRANGRATDYRLLRYRADGTLDPGFGEGGAVTVDVKQHDSPIGLDPGPEGGSVLVGTSFVEGPFAATLEPETVAISLDSHGAPIAGYGQGGVLVVGAPSPVAGIEQRAERILSVVVAPSGRIVLAGTDGDALLIARAADGGPEAGFGGGASEVTQTASGPATTTAKGLLVAPGGGLLVAAHTNSGRRTPAPALLAFGPGGQPISLGDLGFAPLPVAGPLVADGTDRLVSVGYHGGYRLTRTDLRGVPDPGFGTGGAVELPHGFRGRGVVVGRRGALFVIGQQHETRMGVIRFTTSGRRDRAFGDDGVVGVKFPQGFAGASAAVALPHGGILLGGGAGRGAGLVRLRPDGRVDRSFGHAGRAALGVGVQARATEIVRQGDGFLVAGLTESKDGKQHAFALLVGPDGHRRRAYGRGGFLDTSGMRRPIAILPSHRRLVLVGSSRGGGVVLRAYDPRLGTDDRDFGTRGTERAAMHQRPYRFIPVAAVRGAHGGIVVAGTAGEYDFRGSRVELLRFHG